ncbi:AAA family ATPase [Shewanella sp. GutDb-MelDb]|uniref:AAA family ATPase n=1 Tax=Shewanella sp. GutDb-MelDb TaxID=2058316 RepID=UPI000C7CABE7|nr:AAA family ATPase [Shewanella sp. GutDb-MelDb]PKG55234.1 AAA family ATPase [Shewanella sp. GutDb-MelDb]
MNEVADLRITSVWVYSRKWACFSGVPIVSDGFVRTSGKDIVVVKTKPELLPIKPAVGQHWRITGVSTSRIAAHGDFKVNEHHFIDPERCEVTLPHDGENFIRFIAKEKDFRGIGEVKARELWQAFQRSIFNILQQKDIGRLTKILSEQSAQSLIDGFQKYANLKYSTWFSDRKIPPYIQQKLFKYHKENSVQSIIDNPYRLVTFGMPFKAADDIAIESFDIPFNDIKRLIGSVEYALKKHSKSGGHTVAAHQDIHRSVWTLLGSKELASKALKIADIGKSYFIDSETGSYHHTPLLVMEKVVAKRLLTLNGREDGTSLEFDLAYVEACKELPYDLTAKQTDAVLISLAASVSCITGGAGTGKTTVLRTVLKAYNHMGFDIKAIALSGRAAMRLHQSIGFTTSTIAAFLRQDPIESDSKCVVVIDEASMIDLPTMYKIVAHTNPAVRFLFVGDYHQLPPIGAGLILADIVKSGVIKNTELDIVKRQNSASGIPHYSKLIKDGEVPEELSIGHIHFHDVALDDVAAKCVELYALSPHCSQVVAATKKLTLDINIRCQNNINTGAQRLEFEEFGERYRTDLLLNDPVLFTKNNYDAGVQNGSLGRLTSLAQTADSHGLVKLDDSHDEIVITRALLDSLEAGYCITLHKAQGSQFKRVIVALSSAKMLDRAWLYTAVTRSEDELHIVGSQECFEKSVRSLSAHHKRQTHLAYLLQQ